MEHTHQVSYKGQVRFCNIDNYTKVCDALIAELGPPNGSGAPKVEPVKMEDPYEKTGVNDWQGSGLGYVPPNTDFESGGYGLSVTPGTEHGKYLPAQTGRTQTAAPNASASPRTAPGEVDFAGRLRAQGDEITAIEAGFAPKPPIYSIGTRVNSTGVSNAQRMQEEHDKKPLAVDCARALVQAVQAEQRRDLPAVKISSLVLTPSGALVIPEEDDERGRGMLSQMTDHAFTKLFSRYPGPNTGGAYLRSCPAHLRADNFNYWSDRLHGRESAKLPEGQKATEPLMTVLRTRNIVAAPASREIFASVSPDYTSFDADQIGLALEQALPPDARGTLDYDGQRMRLEALWRTDVAPGEFVAGEIFKAGVIIRSDDTGSGSVHVQSVIWRNLCLNLIIVDKAIGVDIRLKHMGSVRDLAHRFMKAFQEAKRSIDGFRKAWGYAREERGAKLLERVQGTTSEDLKGMTANEALPGIFNGILEANLVQIPGRKKEVVPKLLKYFDADEARKDYGVSRASIVNALTRYAHIEAEDPFIADQIREGAGKLLSVSKSKPLPYSAFEA